MLHEPVGPALPGLEDVVLDRALGHERSPLFAAAAVNDREPNELVGRLLARGWRRIAPETATKVHLVLGDDGQAEAVAALVGSHDPHVVAIRQLDTTTLRHWPGWDEGVVSLGFLPCQFTGAWRLYVSESRAVDLGPALSAPPRPTELLAVTARERDALVDDVVRWRTAALGRWAEGAVADRASAGSPTTDHEADHLRAVLAATRATVSWRITRPLRIVQERRLRGAHR